MVEQLSWEDHGKVHTSYSLPVEASERFSNFQSAHLLGVAARPGARTRRSSRSLSSWPS